MKEIVYIEIVKAFNEGKIGLYEYCKQLTVKYNKLKTL
jgi:hypothetical protein